MTAHASAFWKSPSSRPRAWTRRSSTIRSAVGVVQWWLSACASIAIIARVHVVVDDAARMDAGEHVREPDEEAEGEVAAEDVLAQPEVEGAAADVLEREAEAAAVRL